MSYVKRILQNQSGFSLLEVIASIVLLGIIFLSFIQLIIQSNTLANHNNNRLVLINLADAELERLQAIQFTTKEQFDQYIASHTTQELADKQFTVNIKKEAARQITYNQPSNPPLNEADLQLYNVIVTVSDTSGNKTSSSVAEGYVHIYE